MPDFEHSNDPEFQELVKYLKDKKRRKGLDTEMFLFVHKIRDDIKMKEVERVPDEVFVQTTAKAIWALRKKKPPLPASDSSAKGEEKR